MRPTHHPCGSLPVTGWSVSTWWCHHHQAYWASTFAYVDDTGGETHALDLKRIDFGPFDAWSDVEQWIRESIPLEGLAPT
jgi:hypothetical protein